jgi:8-oxo-dGTP pyrophosphatase MutT (NUDIX family)
MELTANVMVGREVKPIQGEIVQYRLELPDGKTGSVSIGERANGLSASEDVRVDNSCLRDLLVRAASALKPHAGSYDEPAPHQKLRSAGIASVDQSGALTIREPRNHYGGYVWTFAKGRIEPAETPGQAAAREFTEETGYIAEILALIGDYAGDTSITRMYFGCQTGGAPVTSEETESVEAVDPLTAYARFNREPDRQILRDLLGLAASTVPWEWTIDAEHYRCRMINGVIQAEYLDE